MQAEQFIGPIEHQVAVWRDPKVIHVSGKGFCTEAKHVLCEIFLQGEELQRARRDCRVGIELLVGVDPLDESICLGLRGQDHRAVQTAAQCTVKAAGKDGKPGWRCFCNQRVDTATYHAVGQTGQTGDAQSNRGWQEIGARHDSD